MRCSALARAKTHHQAFTTASLASAYTNLPETPNRNLMFYGAGVPDELHDRDLNKLSPQDNRTYG